MFCPNCGKDNPNELKFCASCGTNLEAVSNALTGREEDFLTRFDMGLDQFVARYTEHVFNRSPVRSYESKVVRSWKILGQAVVTTFIDLLMFILMWNILPLRAIILLITTPFRLMSERNPEGRDAGAIDEGYRPPQLVSAPANYEAGKFVPSVTEETTTNLRIERKTRAESTPVTDKLGEEGATD